MPNNYFQFNHFTVQQENCAMKVCTDACLFGAYVADEIKDKSLFNILDIGTGTGLLSLMLVQKTTAQMDAVEIDTAAYQQANKNFQQSSWKERLSIFNIDITQFDSNKKYDCIISNPPFFEGDLKSSHSNKNAAKHDTALTLLQLLQVVVKHLQKDGFFAVLLPHHRVNYCIDEAAKLNLYLNKKILAKQTAKHDYFRGMLFFEKQQGAYSSEEIIIKNANGDYTGVFTLLLKDYYLYL